MCQSTWWKFSCSHEHLADIQLYYIPPLSKDPATCPTNRNPLLNHINVREDEICGECDYAKPKDPQETNLSFLLKPTWRHWSQARDQEIYLQLSNASINGYIDLDGTVRPIFVCARSFRGCFFLTLYHKGGIYF